MKKGGWGSLVFILLISLLLNACGGGNSDTDANGGQILKLNLGTGEPTSLDPAQAFDSNSMQVVHNLFEGLTRLDENDQTQPAAAEKVEKSEDGLTYTFTLRDGLKWSNGDPVTAGDFEYAWKRVLDPDTASGAAFLMYFIKNGEAYNAGKAEVDEVGVKAEDERTLVVELEQPTPFFEELTAYTTFSPVHQASVEGEAQPFAEADGYISNGPFAMKDWKHKNKIVAVKNEHYHDSDAVKLGGIEWSMIEDKTTIYQQFKKGELHLGDAPPDLMGSLIEKGEARVEDASGLEFYRFNTTKEPFTNKKVRQAFAMAVDRQAIVDQVTEKQQRIALGFVSPGTVTESGDFRASGKEVLQDAQFEQAKTLLEEGMKEEGWDELPKVEILYNKDDQHKKVAEAIQEMYREHLGVEVGLQAREVGVFFDEQKGLDYSLSRSSFLPDYNDPYNYLESFTTGHPMNRTGWSNKTYDQLLRNANGENDEAKRMELLHEAEERLMEEVPMFPLFYYNNVILEQENVKGVLRHIVGPNDYKYVEIEE
ncbi:peptide ABC transporter substrate-binding protein [Desmospora profundinema]|uniref:Dipeptide transport system substrate-binding protein n=1 Tax=Desmospora profundinema TaxID=1571184 RepID=A0ABU1IKB8_9BACL|nr:peptide ABC transporter substrate-binding protein [Desmospora profundinema]MDR6224992.1 dipeptide transport system substrate-binding protein [Desmospora profundinema]